MQELKQNCVIDVATTKQLKHYVVVLTVQKLKSHYFCTT